jgi:hypothetical protein
MAGVRGAADRVPLFKDRLCSRVSIFARDHSGLCRVLMSSTTCLRRFYAANSFCIVKDHS